MGNDGVANVQLVDATDRSDGLGVVVMQAVPGVDDQPVAETELDTIANPRQLTGTLGNAVRVGVPPGMQFDGRRTDACGRFDLPGIGVDEQRYFGAAGRQTLNRLLHACLL